LDARKSALQEIDEHECAQAEEQTRESTEDVDIDVDVIQYFLQTKRNWTRTSQRGYVTENGKAWKKTVQ
jgi:hypothetical protein